MARHLHLASGLVLFAYLVVHLLNLAVVLVSVGAADAMLHAIYPVIASVAVTGLLLMALVVHVALALWALWARRTLRLTPYEAAQYALGFAIPLALASHVLTTRVPDSLYGTAWGYYRNLLLTFWQLDPWHGAAQVALLLAAWTHACIGLRASLRLRRWYPTARPFLSGCALLIPALALAGFVAGGNEVALRTAADPGHLERVLAAVPPEDVRRTLDERARAIRLGVALAVAAVLAARLVRGAVQRRRGLVRIAYPDGRSVAVPPGFSVLEASRFLGVPHAAVCGGRGRCSTCRVRVAGAAAALPGPEPEEARVLRRVGAAPDVRLACQLRPRRPVAVAPLLDAALPPRELLRFRSQPRLMGAEREVAIAFADLRDFTRLTEHRLPFDVVHLLNRYFRAMGEAVEAAGGRVDKFIGDGVMALFGADGGDGPAALRAACRAGLEGARQMSLRLAALNQGVSAELGEPLRIGIGLHVGPVIVGEMGHGRAAGATAIGDAVNAASRLEAACKTFGCELVVSEAVLRGAGLEVTPGEAHELAVRGRSEPLRVRAVPRAADLPAAAGPRPRREPSYAGTSSTIPS